MSCGKKMGTDSETVTICAGRTNSTYSDDC